MRGFLYTAIVITYFSIYFLIFPLISYALGYLVLAGIFLSIRGAKRMMKIVSLIFLSAGMMMYGFADIMWTQLPLHVSSSVPLIALLFMLP